MRRGDAASAIGLAALAVAQLWSMAGPGRLPQNLDLMLQFVPNAAYLGRSLAEGRLPLWNPYLGAGMPFAADPGAGAWYVPAWLPLALLPVDAAVRVLLWIHLLLAVAGAYVFMRSHLWVGPAPAYVGAAAFALSTWLPGLAGIPTNLLVIAWLPWLLWAGSRAAQRGGAWIALTAVIGSVQLAGGWPPGAYLSWLTLGGVVVPYLKADVRGVLRRLVGAFAVCLMLSGALLVPAAEFLGETNYGETRPLSEVGRDGYLTLLSWLRPAGGTGAIESGQLYAGIAPLVLAISAPFLARRRETFVWMGITALAVLTSLGVYGPLFGALHRFLPGFRIVHLPARAGMVAAFGLACLAALALERLTRNGDDLSGAVPSRRAKLAAVGAVVALVPLTLVQFWHAQGYDDFRRLLTNLGRLTGGPFLTREQELHYLLAGALTVAVVLLARHRRRAVVAGAVVALTAGDLALAQWRAAPPAFDARGWFGRAEQEGARLRDEQGGERIAGLQWHGTRHFLTDFPGSADPGLLPPNLSLLAGVRDAQGYNPLLLRRAVEYFGRANRDTGAATDDDHWLWLRSLVGEEVDWLGVRLVLADGAAWRARSVRLLGPHQLRAGSPPAAAAPVALPAGSGTGAPPRLRVVTFLGEGTSLPQGAAVGLVRVSFEGGELEFPLRAGAETAEWAYTRPDVSGAVRHGSAPVALETQVVDPVVGRFFVREYLATADLPDVGRITRVEVVPTLPEGSSTTLNVAGVWLELPGTRVEASGATGGTLLNPSARPRLSAGSGTVAVLEDRPEHIVARVSSTGATSVVLADSFYPGWVARLNGAEVSIAPADTLFRRVDVPPGEHVLTFSYEPRSLWIGLALSAAGLVVALWLAWPAARSLGPRWRHDPRQAVPR